MHPRGPRYSIGQMFEMPCSSSRNALFSCSLAGILGLPPCACLTRCISVCAVTTTPPFSPSPLLRDDPNPTASAADPVLEHVRVGLHDRLHQGLGAGSGAWPALTAPDSKCCPGLSRVTCLVSAGPRFLEMLTLKV